MPWSIDVSFRIEDGVKCMAVYLYNDMSTDEEGSWNVVTAFELRLLSSNSGQVDDQVATAKNKEFSPDQISWGWQNFITVDKLRAGSFIENDMIKIRAHLTVKSFEKINEW